MSDTALDRAGRSRISVELVPRSIEALQRDVATVQDHLVDVDTINVPDLTKFQLSSWDACALAKETAAYSAIPHIRAQDLDPSHALPMLRALEQADLDEILIISGDPPDDAPDEIPGVSALDAISRVRRELPHVRVYAGLDPYRQAPWREVRYAEQKLAAGAAGFFTQPFFDVALMQAWASMVPTGVPMWWGTTTVTSQASKNYWQARNRAVFPTGFELTLEWQRDYAQRAVAFARQRYQHVYLMPVSVDVGDYLKGVV
ncbi:MAG: methylenetetrahydrofolate reductase [Ornithinimicrobium sp.]